MKDEDENYIQQIERNDVFDLGIIVLSMFIGEVQNNHIFDHLAEAAIGNEVKSILMKSEIYKRQTEGKKEQISEFISLCLKKEKYIVSVEERKKRD